VPEPASTVAARIGPIVDSNVHLWDQADNPVFWLSDRTLVRDMLGDYDALPDRYAIGDYLDAAAGFDLRGGVWSDAGAADPVAAAQWVLDQRPGGAIGAVVSLADPADAGFEALVRRLAQNPLVRSVRIRLVPALATGASGPDERLPAALRVLGELGLVPTIEAAAAQLRQVGELLGAAPDAPTVIDHYGWPADVGEHHLDGHLAALARLADLPHVTTRIDAMHTIFGKHWSVERVRPWLLGVVDLFGADRCMAGSDMPIETLSWSFAELYAAYDEVFADLTARERGLLFGGTAARVYGVGRRWS
jgi:predicted TIM-barrel fold metal-dependent hydrolase